MGFLEQLKGWLRSESADAKDAIGDLESRLDRDLSAKERQLNESPSEGLERLQREISDEESSFDAVRDKIDHSSARADAVADLADGPQTEVAVDEDGTERDPDDLDRG